MLESQIVLGWIKRGKDQGIVEKARAALLRVIAVRLQNPVPEEMVLAVEGTNDETILDDWLVAAATASSISELRKAMKKS